MVFPPGQAIRAQRLQRSPMHARFTHQLLDGFIQILLGGKTGILWSNSPDDAG